MKRFIALIIGLFLVFAFIGCNKDGSDINIDLEEFIGNPTNLSISGTTLSWDEVEDANGYIVYANDEEVDKVSANSYNFSSLSEDVLIFRVRTRAPRGMQDSALSASLAYVANKEAEVSSVNAVMQSNDIYMDTAFSEELVNKGMVSSELQLILTELKDFQTSMENADTFNEVITAIRSLLDKTDNIEAFVSAFVKTELVYYLEDQITQLEKIIDTYHYYGSTEEQLQQQIDAYNDLIDEIESNPDAIVLAITSTIEYLISIEELISQDLISLVDSLAETDDVANLNIDELVDVKEEIVSVLRESIPSEEEMVLVMQVFDLLAQMTGTTVSYSTVENYKGKVAAQTLYSIEAFINFLDSFKKADFEQMKAEMISDKSEEMIQAEVSIILVKVFNNFYDDNQNLFDTIENVFTEEEREVMLNAYMESINNLQSSDIPIAIGISSALNFRQLMNIQVIFEDSFSDVLDALVESDGEIIRQITISNSYTSYGSIYSESGYFNNALDIQYDNFTEYSVDKERTQARVQREVVFLLNAYFQSISEDDFEEIRIFFIDSLYEGLTEMMNSDISSSSFPLTEQQLTSLKTALDTGLSNINSDLYSLLKALFKYLVDENVFDSRIEYIDNVHQYYKDEYGLDYKHEYIPGYYDDEYDSYAEIVFMAEVYNGFMSSRNRGYVNNVLAFVFDILGEDALTVLVNLTPTEITEMENNMQDLLDFIFEEFEVISRYNIESLTEAQKTNIDDFMDEVQSQLMLVLGSTMS